MLSTDNERYAAQESKKQLTFIKGLYLTRPIFKKIAPMLKNYTIAEKRYHSLIREQAKDKSL